MAENKIYKGTGRRKSSIAQVRMTLGKGKIIVNGEDVRKYFPYETNVMNLMQPLLATNNEKRFDITAKVQGGGSSGQTEAIRLGIARALLKYDSGCRSTLKTEGFITCDARKKERKKPGLKKARRAPQFSKR